MNPTVTFAAWMGLFAAFLSLRAIAAPAEVERPRVYLDRVEAHWLADGDKFWYRRDLPRDCREFVLVEAATGTRNPAFDHQRVARVLSERTGEAVDADHLPFERIAFTNEMSAVLLIGQESTWRCDLNSYELTDVTPGKSDATEDRSEFGERRRRRPDDRTRSPDGRWEAVVRGHNLSLRDVRSGEEHPLSYDANPTSSYARNAQLERLVRMQYDAEDAPDPVPLVYWSPDSQKLVAMRHHPGTDRRVYLIDSAPDDQVQPKLESYPYLKPGDDLPLRLPRLFDVEQRREIPISNELFPNPWSISNLRWASNSSEFTFIYNQRGHQVLRLVGVDARTGATRPIIDERSTTFICYSQKFFCEYLDDTGEILWMSERDGWNHLYLHDTTRGVVTHQVTRGEWVVQRVEHIDPVRRQVWFRAGGIRRGQDPYYTHFCRVNLDGTELVILTEANGTHSVEYSPDRRYLIDTWSRVDHPPVTELRSGLDGALICTLEHADASELFASGWRPPEPYVARGRDGTTDIYGVIHRPRDFDPARRYPVIEQIYAGPHSFHVPKAFRSSYRWESLLERGFVVVQIDGMGTSGRSKKFHDVCWKNLGDAGFPDRILWMKAAASQYPWMDITRVGIYGGSAGGQNALRALLAHGDFYKAAVADCGCHDNRMDKIWWNEQFMGWPVGPHYEEQSNVTQAHKLQGKLLLMVGELDRNVDPASTMQVVDALIRADKDFDLIVFPGQGHGAGGSPYGERRRNDFFVRHLIENPPSSSADRTLASP